MKRNRIHLSPPNLDREDFASVEESLKSGWIAPVGPQLDEFERKLEGLFDGKRVLALNSGTSALHLALILGGVSSGDHVLVSSFTFAACANVIRYQNAVPIFLDSEDETWNLDPEVLRAYLQNAKVIPKAIIVTHLYGVPAQLSHLKMIASEYDILWIEDAAESLGAKYHGSAVGQFADFGVLSFNGNKVITTSGGGALICSEEHYRKGLYLATQANSGIHDYEQKVVGYNYRLSNVLAGLGAGQLAKLDQFVKRKRQIADTYVSSLSVFIDFPSEVKGCVSSKWLTVGLMQSSINPVELIEHLEKSNVESRRLWKPLHMHPAYYSFEFIGEGVCERLYERGICLPSGTGMTEEEQEFVISVIQNFFRS